MQIHASTTRGFQLKFPAAALAALLALWPVTGHARQGGNLGAGLVAGQPSGLSGKVWLTETNALDLTLGMNIREDWLALNADYLWHDFSLFQIPSGQLALFYGMGLWAGAGQHGAIGGRGVVGIEYFFPKAPLDAFLEICPGTSILPETDMKLDGGIGMRYFF